MAMTFKQIRDKALQALQDQGTVRTWSDTEIGQYVNDGLVELCEAAPILKKVVTLVENTNYDTARPFSFWKMPSGVVMVNLYAVWNAGLPLGRSTVDDEYRTHASWEDQTGTPTRCIQGDYGQGNFRPVPYPAPDPAAWAITTAYVVGTQVVNSAKVYTCITAGTSAGAGGPTTTAADIVDGTVHWAYVGAFTSNTLTTLKAHVSYLDTPLVADGDTPTIPSTRHNALADYACMRAWLRAGEKEDSAHVQVVAGLWQAAIAAATKGAGTSYDRSPRSVYTENF